MLGSSKATSGYVLSFRLDDEDVHPLGNIPSMEGWTELEESSRRGGPIEEVQEGVHTFNKEVKALTEQVKKLDGASRQVEELTKANAILTLEIEITIPPTIRVEDEVVDIEDMEEDVYGKVVAPQVVDGPP
nr:hypothetical protein CFP56_17974 [Quercus suber]